MPKQRIVAVSLFLAFVASAQAAVTIKAIAANGNHSLALDSDGTVWEWGGKWSAPTRVSGLTGIVSVAAGFDYGLAVKNDGTLWAWGANDVGQLGDGTTTSRPTPVQVIGLTGVIGVAARNLWEYGFGYTPYSVAVRSDGTVWEWGPIWESDGWHLGSPPKQVAGLSGVVAVAAARDDSIALKADGTVWIGESSPWNFPLNLAQVSGLTGIVAIAPGSSCLALKYDGTVWECGPGLTSARVAGIDGVAAISFGGLHYLALRRDGTVWSWSDYPFWSYPNQFGQFGDGTTENRTTPGQVSGLTDVVSVAAGGLHSLALKSDGTLWAWGWDGQGQLGIGRPAWRSVPGEVSGLDEVAAIAGGAETSWTSTGSYSFALKRDGAVWVWGQPWMSDKYRPIPEPVVSGFSGGVAIAGYGRLVLKEDGTVWTWTPGWFPYWLQGPLPSDQPVQVSGLDGAVAIASWLALKNDGTVWRTSNPPVQVQGIQRMVGIASGGSWNLAVREDGTVWAWPNADWSAVPAQVSEMDRVAGVAAGWYGDCPFRWGDVCESWWWTSPQLPDTQALALKADGTVWASGLNEGGRLGDRTTLSQTTPVQVTGLTGVARLAASGRHSLALQTDGTVWAWGDNDSGQLGDGTTTTRTTPVRVAGLTGVVAIAVSGTHSLALRRDGTVWSWGQNDSGQLGDGRAMIRTTPVQVIQPGSPDLSIEMRHNGEFAAGGQGVYKLSISNIGLAATTGTVTVTDALQPGLTYVSATGTGWACSAADQVVSCTSPGPVDPGASTAITLTVSVGPSAPPGVTNLATVSNDSDLNTANNSIGDPAVVLLPSHSMRPLAGR